MAYRTYTTEAIVCGSRDSYTSDRSYLLFTEEAGMLWASARSVREEKSKQRFALQDFSQIRVSLVKGKSGWRIGSVESIENAFMLADSQPARAGVASVVKLLRRLVHGEEEVRGAYVDTRDVLQHIPRVGTDDITNLVEHYTLRLLTTLGYIAHNKDYADLVADETWLQSPVVLPGVAKKAIQAGLEASHL